MDDVGLPLLKDKPIDLDDAATNEIVQVDTVAMATAKAFGDVPIRAAFSKVAAIEAEANLIQNQPGSELFTRPNSGPIKNLAGDEKSEDEKRIDQLRDAAAYGEEERKRQREEWEQSLHSYAGLEMSGGDWLELGNKLEGDTELRRWLIDRIKKDGKTDAEAKKLADDVAMLTKMQGIPPDQWTDEQRKLDKDASPQLKDYVRSAGIKDKEMTGPDSAIRVQVSDADRDTSVSKRADSFGNFASAPDLTGHLNSAAIASQNKITVDVKSLPAIPPPASGGLDI